MAPAVDPTDERAAAGAGRLAPGMPDRRRPSPVQVAAARLTQRALRGVSLVELLDDAVVTLADTLGVDMTSVLLFDEEDADRFLVVAGHGCLPGIVGSLRVPVLASAAGHAVALGGSLTWRPQVDRDRFPASVHLVEAGIEDSLIGVIEGPEHAFGVLQAHARTPRTFSSADLLFVQTVANVIGSAILRDRAELALMEAEEAERRRIAEAVHDDTLQVMLALALRLEALERRSPVGELRDQLHGITVDARDAGARLRALSFDLFPEDLRDGLGVSVRRLLEDLAADGGPAFELHVDLPAAPPLPATRTLWRNIAESVANVRKHAQATHLVIDIRAEGDGTHVRIADDGIGIPVRAAEQGVHGHLGIKGLYERTRRCGGHLSIGPGPDRGTVVDFWIPNAPGRDSD